MLLTLIPHKLLLILNTVLPLAVSLLLILLFKNKLPKDHGREFAFNGSLSAGKIRGAGILFVIAFVVTTPLFVTVSGENMLYLACVFVSMLSGYFDDRSETSWNEYKKGIIDLVICALTSTLFATSNPELLSVSVFGFSLELPLILYIAVGTVFLWMMINAVNCSDGIDGYSGSLAINSMVFISIAGTLLAGSAADNSDMISFALVMTFALLPYLWFNAEPSSMMMGDAGSRALGIFLGIMLMKTGNILLSIPLCLVFLVDGLLGIAKVSLKRFLKISILKNTRTPIHDHLRKNKGWSNVQTIYRLNILQAVISLVTVLALK